ncbi:flippase activity-associated protein Agl23 [Methanoregula sp.]|uniref:flippase activity-associated protein Agl23 n=1 Tax=Methanoregula sp. TaxID=2052170 RepID=UPI003C25F439
MEKAAFFSDRIKQIFTYERVFLLIFLLAIILRFWHPDLKLFHHDEAIHSWFSFNLLTKGSWVYDPSYHGPFLYYVTAGMFSLFGASDLVARLLPALFGTLLVPLVYFIYRLGYITRAQTLIIALFLAISPDMVYFSRFLRHDIFMLFFTMLLLVAILYYFERGQLRYVIIAAIAAGGALCCKEEMPFILLIFITFFGFAIWRKRINLPPQWKNDLIIGLLIIIGILITLYSAFGMHPETLVGQNFQINSTGWYQAIDHWVAMSNEQRLGGPFYFYVPLYLLYEVPIFLLAILGTLQFIFEDFNLILTGKRVKNWLSVRQFKLSINDLALTSKTQLKSAKVVDHKSDLFFQLCIYWMILTMAFYAYVGEKVPWLIIHQLLPMCFVAVYKLNWQKAAFALIGCLFLILMTWHVAFISADINEPIVQVQNSEDLRQVMGIIDNSSQVVLASEDYWPLPWYYRGDQWDKITFYGQKEDINVLTKNSPGVIILHDTESYDTIPGYNKTTYKLDYWFSFYDNQDRLLDYYFHRDGTMGSINLDVFTMHR